MAAEEATMTAEEDIKCTVCGDSGDYKNDRFIFCDECNVGFHQSCYGLQDRVFTDSESDKFYCHFCAQIQSTTREVRPCKKCMLCAVERQELAVMAVDGDTSLRKFVHVVCKYGLLYIPHCLLRGQWP